MNKNECHLAKSLYLRSLTHHDFVNYTYDYMDRFDVSYMTLISNITTKYTSRSNHIDTQNVKTYIYQSNLYRVRQSYTRIDTAYIKLSLRE